MAFESLCGLGLFTLFLFCVAHYANTHRAEDKNDSSKDNSGTKSLEDDSDARR